jgi:hypothetical protein
MTVSIGKEIMQYGQLMNAKYNYVKNIMSLPCIEMLQRMDSSCS